MTKFFVISLVCLASASISFAADGSSGCGPGWYVLKDNSLVSSSLRATTDASLFPVTTIGMTLGTSNCTKHTIVLKEKESLHFATMNYYALKADVAKGNGQYLTAFAETMGCESRAQVKLNKGLKNNYEKIFKSGAANPENALLEVYKTIFRDGDLTNQCSLHVG